MATSVNDIIVNLSMNAKGFSNVFDKAKKQISRFQTGLEKWFKRFDGWALSIMFFGMAIQRVFSTIMKSGVKTFQDIMHSVEGTVTPFDRLKASIESLKFEVGNAIAGYLEPLMPTILGILDRLDEWMQVNQKLVSEIIIFGFAIGTILMAFGMLWLGMKPIVMAIYYIITKRLLAPLLLIGLMAYDVTAIWGMEMPKWQKLISTVILAVVGLGVAVGLLPIWWAIAFAAVLAIVIKFREKIAINWLILSTRIAVFIKDMQYKFESGLLNIWMVWASFFKKIINAWNSTFGWIMGKEISFDAVTDGLGDAVANTALELSNLKKHLNVLKDMKKDIFEGGTKNSLIDSILGKKEDVQAISDAIGKVTSDLNTTAEDTIQKEGDEELPPEVGQFKNIYNIKIEGGSSDEIIAAMYEQAGTGGI
ncbi:hypothetical protein [uncultured Arcobacter sp.]|uniref:hypothetical protein n=1 Tax=uncultured Arcobacter sp. TaxID=165434 RepID=UPI0026301143|nr:hypothetical protein [uncultured Arcobacter sp.]